MRLVRFTRETVKTPSFVKNNHVTSSSTQFSSSSSTSDSKQEIVDNVDAPNTNVQQEQITHFQDDSAVIKTAKPMSVVNSEMTASGREERVHELKDFLRRPVRLATATVTSLQGVASQIVALSFPDAWETVTMWREKTEGFRLLRADLHFRALLNGNPYDTGRWYMMFAPYESAAGDYAHLSELPCITGYPGVEIDLGTGSTTELTIPYASMFTHYDQATGFGLVGDFYVYVITPFNTVNAGSNATLNIYAWMDNIDLSVPVDLSWVPPSPAYVSSLERKLATIKKNRAQGGGEQEHRSTMRTVVGGARAVSKAASPFASAPLVGKLAEGASWIGDAVEGVASLVGLSRPTSTQAPSPLFNVPMQGYTHGEDLDAGVRLSVIPHNEVEVNPAVCSTAVDEMEISHVVSKMSWFSSFEWKLSDPEGTQLFAIPVHPGLTGDLPLAAGEYAPTLVSYVASGFELWRGSIKLRFSTVKNPFYSGRLTVAYVAGAQVSQVSAATLNWDALPKWVVDLRESNDITVTVPYAAPSQWLRVALSNAGDQGTLSALYSLGVIIVRVENQLRAPDSVPDSVGVNVWMQGGNDLQFAVPDFQQYTPVRDQMMAKPANARKPTPPRRHAAQGFTAIEDSFAHMNQLRAGVQTPETGALLETSQSLNTFPTKACIGEAVSSLRTLTRRFSEVTPLTGYSLWLDPMWFGNLNNAKDQSNPRAYFAHIYRFKSGGESYKVHLSSLPGDAAGTRSASQVSLTATSITMTEGSPQNMVAGVVGNPNAANFQHKIWNHLNPVLEFTTPFYSTTPSQLISTAYPPGTSSRMLFGVQVSVADAPPPGGWSNPTISVYRAMADDGNFMWLVGPPHLKVYGT